MKLPDDIPWRERFGDGSVEEMPPDAPDMNAKGNFDPFGNRKRRARLSEKRCGDCTHYQKPCRSSPMGGIYAGCGAGPRGARECRADDCAEDCGGYYVWSHLQEAVAKRLEAEKARRKRPLDIPHQP